MEQQRQNVDSNPLLIEKKQNSRNQDQQYSLFPQHDDGEVSKPLVSMRIQPAAARRSQVLA
jgi:hypothetical protein